MTKLTFQQIIFKLQEFWEGEGCLIFEPYNSEVGAATFNPATFLRILGPEPWKVAYLEPARRPKDGRYAQNPNRVQQYHQFQVILKPSPKNVQEIYLDSLRALNINLEKHDVRFVEDDWESPTLGAWGLGWEVWLDGLEITQFTYMQQAGGIDLEVPVVEITYGLERITMELQGKNSIFDILWDKKITWGEVFGDFEREFSHYNYEELDHKLHLDLFQKYEEKAQKLLQKGLLYPGYDLVIKLSHIFNLLDARGILSVSERANMITRVRNLAKQAATCYLKQREEKGYPLINGSKRKIR